MFSSKGFIHLLVSMLSVLWVCATGATRPIRFSYKPFLQDTPKTLHLNVQSMNAHSGQVEFNGVDTTPVVGPFTWDFGDGVTIRGWFPQKHTFADTGKNYIVKITSHYTDSITDSAEVLVRFVGPTIHALEIPEDLGVSIPDFDQALGSRMPGYAPPSQLSYMQTSCFNTVAREIIEYVMSLGAVIQMDFVNRDVLFPEGNFNQIVLRDPWLQGGGMYSLWFTTPVSFAASCAAMNGSIAYSSFFHEIGHNVTLNFPLHYHFGGKIDGNANAIYSETMAQIFQHATAYEMLNHADTYGLGQDLMYDIAKNAEASFLVIKKAYHRYLNRDPDNRFSSWNSPSTPSDETLDTFMTLAYRFIEHVELANQGFRGPTQRLCQFLAYFNAQWRIRFSPHQNSASAESFRASLMVAALSHAVNTDLREDFKALSFPIDDTTFDDLMDYVQSRVPLPTTTLADLNSLSKHWLEDQCSALDNWCSGADRNASGIVNFVDYVMLARHWSETTQ